MVEGTTGTGGSSEEEDRGEETGWGEESVRDPAAE